MQHSTDEKNLPKSSVSPEVCKIPSPQAIRHTKDCTGHGQEKQHFQEIKQVLQQPQWKGSKDTATLFPAIFLECCVTEGWVILQQNHMQEFPFSADCGRSLYARLLTRYKISASCGVRAVTVTWEDLLWCLLHWHHCLHQCLLGSTDCFLQFI